jgi:hypothetical protein
MDHKASKDRHDKEDVRAIGLGNQQGIADQHGTQKHKVKEVVHVEPPLHKTCIAQTSDRTKQQIGNVLADDHSADGPEPMDICSGKVTEGDHEEGSDNGEQGQMVSLQP